MSELQGSPSFFNFLQSVEASCSPFFFSSSCAWLLCFWGLFSSLYHGLQLILGNRYLEQNSVEKNFLPSFCSKFVLIPSSLNKNFMWSTPPCSVRKQKNLLLPQFCWKLEGASSYVVVYRILAFSLLSLNIGLRDYTVYLCEYGQLAFTNMYLSIFLLFKTKDIFLMGLYRSTKYGFEMIGWVKWTF